MSDIFENAVTSIILGIEDFEAKTDERMLSAARNYYAGLLLLAKECLVSSAPGSETMDIIGAKFKPIPNGNGGVKHVVMGYTTVDINLLQSRFKDFGLPWPDVNIKQLQQFRNNIEHYHSNESASSVGEAIASSFSMVIDFFKILEKDPQEHLADVWGTILAEREAHDKVKASCLASLAGVRWPASVENLDKMTCPRCHSSLVGQVDGQNSDHQCVEGKCSQCGEEIDQQSFIELIVDVSYSSKDHMAIKDGDDQVIHDCFECLTKSYVIVDDFSGCFSCGAEFDSDCWRCGSKIWIEEYNVDYAGLCSWCAHMAEKAMRD